MALEHLIEAIVEQEMVPNLRPVVLKTIDANDTRIQAVRSIAFMATLSYWIGWFDEVTKGNAGAESVAELCEKWKDKGRADRRGLLEIREIAKNAVGTTARNS